MERQKLKDILTKMYFECKKVNSEMKSKDPENKLIYEVLQFSDLAQRWDIVHKIADFYNRHWYGNKDFMHIPNFKQVLNNCLNYPIIIAREEGKDEILGISTIKYDENTEQFTDPYFPIKDAKYFSITGILTNKDTNHRGMGKKIYEIAVNSVCEYNKEHPGTQLMCVVDCRNQHSLNALATAVDNINKSGRMGENKELSANILGYYEVRDKMLKAQLQEAPTLVLGVDLNGEQKSNKKDNRKKVLEYNNTTQSTQELLESLRKDLRGELENYKLDTPTIGEDPECGIVCYYPLKDKFSIIGTRIIPNNTEKGNDREFSITNDKEMKEFIGPIRPIAVEKPRKEVEGYEEER